MSTARATRSSGLSVVDELAVEADTTCRPVLLDALLGQAGVDEAVAHGRNGLLVAHGRLVPRTTDSSGHSEAEVEVTAVSPAGLGRCWSGHCSPMRPAVICLSRKARSQ
jgi:hypothetical protein